jgi:hypothetical protein
MLFQLVQIIYWIALSTWFGSVMFIALAAPIIFRTVRANNPILTDVLSVNLEGQHSTLLAGTIVANLIQRLLSVEWICGAAVLIALIIQPFVIDLSISSSEHPLSSSRGAAILRAVLFLAAAGIVVYDWLFVWPKVSRNRNEYIEHADEPEKANPAKERFDREQQRSLTLLTARVALLMGMILFSANISPPSTTPIQSMPASGK